MAVGHQVDLDGPARRERHEGRPVLAGEHDAFAGALEFEDALEQVGPELPDRVEQARGARRDVGVGVDLPVRVLQGDADRLAAVLEREHLLDAGHRRELGGAVRPRLDDGAGAAGAEAAERAFVLGTEADHFAAADGGAGAPVAERRQVGEPLRRVRVVGERRTEGGRLVLEHGHVVERRHLGGVAGALRRERVELGGRQEGAVLAGGGDRDPVTGENVLAHGGGGGARVELATVERALGPEGGVGVVEVDEFAAVGEGAAVVSDGHLITILKAALADATEIERRAERKGDHG